MFFTFDILQIIIITSFSINYIMKNIVQILLILILTGPVHAQTPFQVNCPGLPLTFCDFTPNDTSLWHEPYWYDPQNDVSNLSEGPVDLRILITDSCANVRIHYRLFLDLDQDSILETMINSDSLPGYNNLLFNNLLGPGTPRAFDERMVSANEKYGFALQKTLAGDSITVALRWNTQQAPSTYIIPELPYGLHKIRWIIADTCGNETSCEYTFTVKDCKPPTVVCIFGSVANITATAQMEVTTANLLLSATDNSSPAALLDFSIRKSGIGPGFPVDSLTGGPITTLTFDCSELGIQPIELWARDVAGNVDFCETYVIVMDTSHNCPGSLQQVTTCFNFWKDGSPIPVEIDYPGSIAPAVYDSLGCLVVTVDNPGPSNLTATPVLNSDPLNGVNTLDLVRMSRHILGLTPLASPYAMIAADANKSGSITTFDIQELKKLLLGIYADLPNNTSWRFVDAGFVFPNPNNPFQQAFPENAVVSTQPDSSVHFAFTGVKVGDVDGTAYPGFAAPADDRTAVVITLPDALLLPGETLELPLRIQTAGEWLGLQMGLSFDARRLAVDVQNTEHLPGWDASSWASPQPGLLQLAWFDAQPQRWLPDEKVLTLRIHALGPVRLQEVLGLATKEKRTAITAAAITGASEIRPLQLLFTPPSALATTNAVFAPQPNPTRGGDVQIPVRLNQSETVRLQLTGLAGRLLFQNEQILAAGNHWLVLPAMAFPQSGLYIWQVQAGNMVAGGKIVKM